MKFQTIVLLSVGPWMAFVGLQSRHSSPNKAIYPRTGQCSQTMGDLTYIAVASFKIKGKRVLWISTDPGTFTRQRMILLARRLNTDFINESSIDAIIFDSEEAARNYRPAGGSYYVSKKLERAEYELNRKTHREYISFSSNRGKPITENRIKLDGSGSPVKRK